MRDTSTKLLDIRTEALVLELQGTLWPSLAEWLVNMI